MIGRVIMTEKEACQLIKWFFVLVLWIIGGCLGCLDAVILKIIGVVLLSMSIMFFVSNGQIAKSLSSVINRYMNRYIKWYVEQQRKDNF